MSTLRAHTIAVAVIAVAVEVLLLRFALRLGPVLPMQAELLPLFAVVEWLGVTSLNLGVLACSAAIGLSALDAARAGGDGHRPVGILVALALVGAVAVNLALPSLVGIVESESLAVFHAAVTGAAVVLVAVTGAQPRGVKAVLLVAALGQVLALSQAASQGLSGAEGGVLQRPIVLAEVAAVVAALALPWVSPVRPRRAELAAGLAAGLVVTAGGVAQPWGMATVAIWTMAFSLFMPSVVYGAALASVIAAGLALRRVSGGPELLAGLTLIWLGGLKLDISSMALMGLAGLVVASRPSLAVASRASAGVRMREPGWLAAPGVMNTWW